MEFGSIYGYRNQLDLICIILDIYLTVNPKKPKLIIREKEALAYYIINGFSDKTVKEVESFLTAEINNNYVRSINSSLRKKGYLVKDERNYRKSRLAEDMLILRKEFVEGNNRKYMIGFKKL